MDLKTPSQSSSSSSSASNLNVPVSASYPNYVFGPVPSKIEVDFAISVLQKFVLTVFSNWPESNQVVQMLDSSPSRLMVSYGLKRLYDAFRLWQIDPSVQRMVASLAYDIVVWDAVMKNELVQELKEPLRLVRSKSEKRTSRVLGNGRQNCTSEKVELAATLLNQIWESTKAKVIELMEKFQCLMNKMFQHQKTERPNPEDDNEEQLKHKVESSLLLAVLTILIVLVVRANGA